MRMSVFAYVCVYACTYRHANVWHKQPMHVHVSVCVTDGSHAVPSGNDLARALKWGSGYTGEKPVSILRGLENTDKVDFDRWVCMCACMCACVCVCVCVCAFVTVQKSHAVASIA